MNIIALTTEHAAPYRDLMLHGYEHAPDAFTSTPQERAAMPLSWWALRIADPTGLGVAFGAMDGDTLVGTVALEFSSKPKTRHKAHLIGMYVLEAWRGHGVGRELVAAAMKHAAQRPGISIVTLTATEGNAPAIALYEAAGFRTFGVEPMAIRTPSGYKAKVHMCKEIA
ncbi:GNAT family N-acetyltransferase [Ideonella sp. YS5]|uniref:GNAT family N-acetyltransferase n=1 Tax=Ideonella sp. YS5 TaxID=3453714 RepID=UPI003EEF4E2E